MKRTSIKGLVVGFIAGLIGGAVILLFVQDRLNTMWRPMGRIIEAAEVSEYTYALYLHAPYPVAEDYLDREATMFEQLAAESSDELERGSFQHELAVNRARLAKLATRHGEDEKAKRLLGEAMIHVNQSGRSTTQQELIWFVDQIDERIGKKSYGGVATSSQKQEQPDA